MNLKRVLIVLVLFVCCMVPFNAMGKAAHAGQTDIDDKLIILWTSADKDVAEKMVFMYAYNYKAPSRWKEITLIIWGPSAELISKDKKLQVKLVALMKKGIIVKACKGCADEYGASEKLIELGIDVKYMGQELTDYIKNKNHMITI